MLRKMQVSLREQLQMSSTFREIQSVFLENILNPRFWMIFLVMVALFAIVGPFNSFSQFDLPMRFAYWGTLMTGSWLIATVFMSFGLALFKSRIANGLVITLIAMLLASFPIAAFLNIAIGWFITLPEDLGFWYQFKYAAPIALGFGMILHFALQKPQQPKPNTIENALIKRLPHAKRGPVQHMTMQDHYVSVTTTKGTELILMRMADAVTALQEFEGLQIHRSHWVAKNAVVSSKRENGQPFVILTDGTTLPVSRSFTKNARNAGVI